MARKKKAAIYFYPLDIDYETTEDGRPQIRIFGLTQDKKRIVVLDPTFVPYFWVIPKNGVHLKHFIRKLKGLEIRHHEEIIKIRGARVEIKKYLKEKVRALRITADHPGHIPLIVDVVKKLPEVEAKKEFDIQFYRRYLIDRELIPHTLCSAHGEFVRRPDLAVDYVFAANSIRQATLDLIPEPQILAFDFEIACEGVVPDPGRDAIILCSFYGSGGFKKVISWKAFKNPPDYVTFVDGEIELIEEFKKTILQFKPDILVGYGTDNFDFPYLRERAAKYNIKLDFGLDGSSVETRMRGMRGVARITGIVHLDIFSFIRNILGATLETERYRLDLVAKEMLGFGKLFTVSQPRKIGEIWNVGLDEELVNLVEYNLRDSELAYKLCLETLPTQLQIVKLIGLPLFDVDRMTYGQLVEWYLIRNAPRFNQICPNRPTLEVSAARRAKTYVGGFVFEPEAGLYKNIGIFDYRSLYPSILASHNIGPTTINCKCCKFKGGHRTELDGEKYWFCSKTEGFLPSLVRDLVERRKRIKSILVKTKREDPSWVELNSRSYALKTIANSFYGYQGFAGARWYCFDCARAITAFGRKYIQAVIKEAKKFGFDVIYADTDGAFLLLKNKKPKDIRRFLHIINSILPKPMELEYQGFYPRGIFFEKKGEIGGAKKRYALIREDGTVEIKGFEFVRRDWANIAKTAQEKVIEAVLRQGRPEKAVQIVKKIIEEVKERKTPLKDLVIYTQVVRKISTYEQQAPHVKAAKKLIEAGYKIKPGSVLEFVVVKGPGSISDRSIPIQLLGRKQYDPDYYIDNQILPAVMKILSEVGVNEEDLKFKGKQKGITEWV